MMRLTMLVLAVLMAAIGTWSVGLSVFAQGSGSSRLSPPPQRRPKTAAEFQRDFWQFLTRGKKPYTQWKTWPASGELQAGSEPHGAFGKTYVNSSAAANPDKLPHGAILVHEDCGQDQTTVESVTVMYRVKGTDADHYDWYWLKYLPDGTVAKAPRDQGGKPLAGKVGSCIECHAKAGGDDLVYGNDTPPESPSGGGN